MAGPGPETDCTGTKATTSSMNSDLHNRIMGGPPPCESAAAAGQPQKIVVQVELVQPQTPRDPEHLKVHRNPFSVVGHALGHFGKQYALGVKDSVEPRNLGRMTLPVGIGVGTQLVVANAMKKGLESGFNQIGAGMKQLGGTEAQLGAGEVQLAQQMAALQAEINALQGVKGATSIAGQVGRQTAALREPALLTPRITATAAMAPETSMSAAISIPGVSTTGTIESAVLSGAVPATGIAPGAHPDAALTMTKSGMPDKGIVNVNATADLPNVGIDRNGYAVPLTPRQLEQARAFQTSSDVSETQLANASRTFDQQFAAVADAMSTSPNAQAFLNDLRMRYQYAMAYDKQGDHKSARAFLSDAGQDVDNLKRAARSEHNPIAIAQIDLLKQSVKSMDGVEKHFAKAPPAVLVATDQTATANT